MKNHTPMFIFFTLFLIAIRCITDNHPDIVFIVSLINLGALLAVIYLITEQVINKVIDRISKSNAPQQIIEREQKDKKITINLIAYIIFIAFALVYLLWFKSSLGNDIISIVALGLSLIDTYLINIISNSIKI